MVKIYGLKLIGTITKKPQNTHLDIELTSGNKILVDSNDNTKVYHLNTSTRVETQIDVDPSNTSGDNKSRDHDIQSMWHDRANKIIWAVDCDNPGDDFDVWKYDYSGGEVSGYSVTEVGNYSGADAGTQYVYDICIIGSDVYVYDGLYNSGIGEFGMFLVTSAPFVKKDHDTGWSVEDFKCGFGIVIGDEFRAYFAADASKYIYYFNYDVSTNNTTYGAWPGDDDRGMMPPKNQRGIAYDGSDNIYMVAYDMGGSDLFLHRENLSGNSFTRLGKYNISLMLDRNTNSSANVPFNLEKGFETTDGGANGRKIYQIAPHRGALNQIAYLGNLRTDGNIVAITDHYIIYERSDTTIELWEFIDLSGKIDSIDIEHEDRDYPTGTMTVLPDLGDTLIEGCFVQIIDNYSQGGSTNSDKVVFEGIIDNDDLKKIKTFPIESLGREIDDIKPNLADDFSQEYINTNYNNKKSGQLFKQLIKDYCNHCSEGTISDGTLTWAYPSDIQFEGFKSLRIIWNKLADAEKYLWKMRPQGKIDFDGGTVDSGVDISNTDQIEGVDAHPLSSKINRIIGYGGFVDGIQIGPKEANNKASQLLHGIISWSKTWSGIKDATKLQTTVNNKLELEGAGPLVAEITRRNVANGFIPPGEEVTINENIKIDDSDKTLPTGQYLIKRIKYNPRESIAYLKLTDGMLFQEQAQNTLPEQNSQLIKQLGGSLVDESDHAIHDNVSDEIHQITEKGSPADADVVVIEDSAAGWVKKRVPISGLGGGNVSSGAGDPTSTPSALGDIYINTTQLKIFIAAATEGSYNWGYVGRGNLTDFGVDTVPGLVAWFDADSSYITKDGSDNVTQWNDRSGNGNHLTSTPATKPVWYDNILNGYPAVYSGGNTYIANTSVSGITATHTVIIVLKPMNIGTGGHQVCVGTYHIDWDLVCGKVNGSLQSFLKNGSAIYGENMQSNRADVWTFCFNGASSFIKRNNNAKYTGNSPDSFTPNRIALFRQGKLDLYDMQGYICEVLIYSDPLSDANLAKVLTYLNNKYGIW